MISVIMSTYNRVNTLKKAIKSIINQTYKDWEFIICDDCSTDSTLECLHKFANLDNRIKIIVNKHNMGLQRSLNKCLKVSKGRFIARMDDDDVSRPDRFQKQLKFLDDHSNISFVGSNVLLSSDTYGIYGRKKFIEYPNSYQLFKNDEFCHPSVMIRASILKKVHGYSESRKFYRIEDHELWLRLYSLKYRGANIQQSLLIYNFNITSKKSKFYDYFNRFRLLCIYKNKLEINSKGYIYIILSLIKVIIPSFIRNKVYRFKYLSGKRF